MTEQTEKKPINWKKEIIEWVLTFAIPVVVAMLIHNYLFTFARVDGDSMLDTFHTNNITGVSRLHYRLNEPQRGEVVTCHYDESNKLYVKRIIGLPGETVELRMGKLYVNGVFMEQDFEMTVNKTNFGPIKVPEDSYFVLGDNRNNSKDSRSAMVGPLERNMIKGHVRAVVFPFGNFRLITD